jgi:hypothetical protein
MKVCIEMTDEEVRRLLSQALSRKLSDFEVGASDVVLEVSRDGAIWQDPLFRAVIEVPGCRVPK